MKSRTYIRQFAISLLVVAGCIGIFLWINPFPTKIARACPASYAELIAMPETQLAGTDIALMNLLCAEGLPAAENLDVRKCLAMLDKWADVAKAAERKYASQYQQNPERYDRSFAKFKAVNLALAIKQDLGCGYNMDLVNSGAMADIQSTRFFRNSKDIFLHGFTTNRKGSCSSLPVLIVAVGRRCGYPLYLVPCKAHLFCRWEDGKERFNIEVAGQGVDSQPDAYYRKFPHPCSDEEVKAEKYLKSLTSTEELGVFAELRAFCLQENGRIGEARQAYDVALQCFPESRMLHAYRNRLGKEK
jgi:hypothetical protein